MLELQESIDDAKLEGLYGGKGKQKILDELSAKYNSYLKKEGVVDLEEIQGNIETLMSGWV